MLLKVWHSFTLVHYPSYSADLLERACVLNSSETRSHVQDVNQRLATASSERGEYRQYLMEAQKELQNTRTELLEWSEGLSELKEVMEGLDGDLSDLFGDTDYANVVNEALTAARRLPGTLFYLNISQYLNTVTVIEHVRACLPE